MPDRIKKFIEQDPQIKNGMPIITGTRVTVAEIIDYLEEEKFIDKVIKDLKMAGVIIGREEILAALEFAKLRASDEAPTSKKTK
ncbi:MAG: hypothetical protein ACD_30C00056G0007 [uncultured bacterium]|uniref:DUF433 domain-containing protein n=4 Tax=Candidatus Daviesiibacteriota TaxID=1752718 RepID=A0A0G0HZF5_9BACT|nr:MAG: hypothetical protein ACD_30C00056G0007 [uncultured bacterium]KKQ09216.1 MAG: hypothetical protein US19_C0015G0009 [Candidatus Daviesbacteria bacterium GW2011_GWB1_36_5]KKQ14727.1 MAG: hypothetical protein US28_C0031G0010 [Candidatus Daviesbacteria bacterium GW2011_GWA1_36_8]OGE17057.1 MAG: hypothetical protein A2858_01495 [Candidatus Daviesbacteria bacterium RIFCSPHIGHO2_01_FULL_36_37]OGE32690.1 MAG: hypothetical protein A3C99_03200 [Candidatus Daviesbacteria bacterium RIFCSPHIGHO2_02_F